MSALLPGSITAAGHIASGILIVYISKSSNVHKKSSVATALCGIAAAGIICLYWAVMSPIQLTSHSSRLTGISLLLSNGRNSLAALFPMTIIWFMGIIAAIAAFSFTGAFFIQKSINSKSMIFPIVMSATASFLLACLGFAESNTSRYISYYTFAAMCIMTVILYITMKQKNGGCNAEK